MTFPLVALLRPALKLLGKLGKGKATVTGLVGIAAGLGAKSLIGDVITSENVVEVIRALADIVVALGGVVAAFGFGRKTGYAAKEAP